MRYIGLDLGRIKDLATVEVADQGALTLQVSKNMVDWADVEAGKGDEDELEEKKKKLEAKAGKIEEIDNKLEGLRKEIEADEKKVEKIVMGYPLNMNGTLGPQSEYVLEFKKMLEEETKLEVILFDERLTTVEVQKVMISAET